MKVQIKKHSDLESISIMDCANAFFDSFTIDGNFEDVLGLESMPRLVDAAGVCVCMEGEADIVINAQSYHIAKGDMCVVVPNSILQVKGKSDDFEGYTAAVIPDFFNNVSMPSSTSIYLYVKDNPCISLESGEIELIVGLCEALKEHDLRTEHPFRYEISQLAILTIFYEIAAIYKKRQPLRQQSYSRKNKLFLEFMQLVAVHYDRQRSIDFYADKLCITPRYLSSVTREVSGMTASESIERVVILNARILLASTDMTIQQISDRLNFPNHSFFSKYFKRITGITPKECRMKARYFG